MKKVIKFVVAVATVAVGIVLGLVLLVGFVPWKIPLFALACWGIGHGVYSLLRFIDRKFQDEDT